MYCLLTVKSWVLWIQGLQRGQLYSGSLKQEIKGVQLPEPTINSIYYQIQAPSFLLVGSSKKYIHLGEQPLTTYLCIMNHCVIAAIFQFLEITFVHEVSICVCNVKSSYTKQLNKCYNFPDSLYTQHFPLILLYNGYDLYNSTKQSTQR